MKTLILLFAALAACPPDYQTNLIHGAWHIQEGPRQQVILFEDGYFMHTTYDKNNKKFIQSNGGTFSATTDQLTLKIEFDTENPSRVGTSLTLPISIEKENMWWDPKGKKQSWMRLDDGSGPLAGNWRITDRMQGDQMVPMPQTARKTLKLLTGSRFQWAAIDPETKQFFGTGGGTYTFKDGKYTESIEFFSRDSSRVGASLTFDGNVVDGKWHHRGLSSRGEQISEIWGRVK